MLITNPTNDILKITSDDKQHTLEVKQTSSGFKIINDTYENGAGVFNVSYEYSNDTATGTMNKTYDEISGAINESYIINLKLLDISSNDNTYTSYYTLADNNVEFLLVSVSATGISQRTISINADDEISDVTITYPTT